MIFTCISPCKINEFLYITGRRSDGYHDLETLFVVLNYGDPMSFEIIDDDVIELDASFDFPKEQNLIYRAAMLLKVKYGVKKGCRITVDKLLPQGGGLGGGSGNAATVLQVLSVLWDIRLDDEILMQLGMSLGADVPLFIKGVSTFGRGRGEILTPVNYPPRFYLVVNPGCKAQTSALFSSPLLKRDSKPLTYTEHLKHPFENAFTPVVCAQFPQVVSLLQALSCYQDARMSGSGSSCFGSFDNKEACDEAYASFKKKHPDLFCFKASACLENTIKKALREQGFI